MKKSRFIISILALALFAVESKAQFEITRNDNTTQTLPGNASFTTADEGKTFTINGIPVSDIKSLQRVKREGAIILDRQVIIDGSSESVYFKPAYGQPQALYLVTLSNDRLVSYGNTNIPKHPGGYIFNIGFAAEETTTPRNPVLPEGSYTVEPNGDKAMTIDASFTWGVLNTNGKANDLKQLMIDRGTVNVKHTEGGNYEIKGDVQTDNGENISLAYNGPITFFNPSAGEEEEDNSIKEDVVLEPQYAYISPKGSSDKENYDSYILRLFTTKNLTSDLNHCGEDGIKMHLSIMTEKGGTIEGEYTMAELTEDGWSVANPQPGRFIEGSYIANIAIDSFLEQVTGNNTIVKTAVIVGGTLKITKVGTEENVYKVEADFVTTNLGDRKPYKATCNWTGVIETAQNVAKVKSKLD